MLPQFYLDYLKTYLPKSEFLILQILVWLLQVHRQVRIERLASSFPYPIKCESRRKKIQRFLISSNLSLSLLWFPLIKKIILTQFQHGDRLIITIDRTQWKDNNISMVSVIWNKRAWPIYWLLLAKKGSSNFYEQVATIRPILKLLKDYKLVVIGDREYRSTALALWLTKKKIDFILRLNKNTLIKPRYKKYQSLDSLDIKPGQKAIYQEVLVTEENKKNRFNVVVYWRRKYKNKQLPNPWYLLTNLENKEEVIKIFASRGGIEAMFRDCKSGGYNLEGSQANPQRLTNLILLIAIAYTASCLVGLKIRNTGHTEYINRLQLEGKTRPRHSYFWTGLYGTTWILSMDICWEWVDKLMRTAINKLPFYQRGLRAMKHIQSIV
ncbi:IS4 family transposase [Pleurocapsa sp. CCALA 161]|uniref:IS4 family transposase n=1 Tax=Pleurocapsa sp. CCALA 161 TaxID=2107688 RepID=UPI000D064315|nr:IS4 family transposase [Pleurocapsa sp. CCALA 161]PSB11624.1 IS4 family transposase [Pleurocapsa sp. CCALA 161]